MTEIDVIRVVRAHLESQFPKVCSNCNLRFATFRDYLLATKPVGSAFSYDAAMGDWNPTDPAGGGACVNCACGNTLILTSAGMPLFRLWALMNWARIETKKRNQTLEELLNYLRKEIDHQALTGP